MLLCLTVNWHKCNQKRGQTGIFSRKSIIYWLWRTFLNEIILHFTSFIELLRDLRDQQRNILRLSAWSSSAQRRQKSWARNAQDWGQLILTNFRWWKKTFTVWPQMKYFNFNLFKFLFQTLNRNRSANINALSTSKLPNCKVQKEGQEGVRWEEDIIYYLFLLLNLF